MGQSVPCLPFLSHEPVDCADQGRARSGPWPPKPEVRKRKSTPTCNDFSPKPSVCVGCSTTIAASGTSKKRGVFRALSGFVACLRGLHQCVFAASAIKTRMAATFRAIVAGAVDFFFVSPCLRESQRQQQEVGGLQRVQIPTGSPGWFDRPESYEGSSRVRRVNG